MNKQGYSQDPDRRGMLEFGGFGLVQAPTHSTLNFTSNVISIELWVNHDGQSDADAFLVNKGIGDEGYRLQFVGDGDEPAVRFAIRNIDSQTWDVVSNAGIPAHRWTHIGAVYDGAQLHLYINGSLDQSYELGAYPPGTNNRPLVFGSSDGGSGNFYSGKMDDVRIWGVSRTTFEMAMSPYQQIQGTETELRAYYKFGDLSDYTSGTNDLTLQGNAALISPDVLPVPPDLVINSSNAQVKLKLIERIGPNNENKASQLKIYRSTAPDGSDRIELATLDGSTTNYTDTGADNGITYWYETTSINDQGEESDYSSRVAARPYSVLGGGSLHLEKGSYAKMSDRPSLDGSLKNVVNFDSGITLELWINHDGNSDENAFLINKGLDAEGYRLQFVGSGDGPGLRFSIRNVDSDTWDVISNAGIPAHRWTHVAAVYDGVQLLLYINGELDNAVDFGEYSVGTNNLPLTLGASSNGAGSFFSGHIDELRVWTTARTSLELKSNVFRILKATENDLATYYRFDDIGTLKPQSSDPYHATMELETNAVVNAGGVYPIPPDLFTRAPNGEPDTEWRERMGPSTENKASQFKLYRSTAADGSDRIEFATLAAETYSYMDTGTSAGTEYYYEVTSINAHGQESGYSPISYVHASTDNGVLELNGGNATVENRRILNGSGEGYVNFSNNITIELWVKHGGLSDTDAFLVNKGTIDTGYRLGFAGSGENPRLRFSIRNIDSNTWDIVSNDSIKANEWTHIAAVYNGAQMKLYLNGELDISTEFGSYAPGLNDNKLVLGSSNDGTSNIFMGEMHDFRLWAAARSENEIKSNRFNELRGFEEGLLAYFRFSEPYGTVAYGSALYPMTANLNGNASFSSNDGSYLPVEEEPEVSRAYELRANYPNPFNPQTTINYSIRESVPVRLTVYNVMGQKMAILIDEVQSAGQYHAVFDATNYSSGIYFYRLDAGAYSATRSMMLVK